MGERRGRGCGEEERAEAVSRRAGCMDEEEGAGVWEGGGGRGMGGRRGRGVEEMTASGVWGERNVWYEEWQSVRSGLVGVWRKGRRC